MTQKKRTLLSILFCLLSTALVTHGQLVATKADVAEFQKQFESLKDQNAHVIEILENAEKKQERTEEEIKHLFKNLHLSYLEGLMEIERDLAIIATPIETASKKVKITGLSSRDIDNVRKIRMEISDAERSRIKEGMKEGKRNPGDEKFHKDLLKKEISIWKTHLKTAKKSDREIVKLEKEISKKRKASYPNESEIDKLEMKIEEILKIKKEISSAIFGHSVGSGFNHNVTPTLSSATELLASLKKERDAHIHFLRTGETNKGEKEKRGGNIGGTFFYSENLGVVLDISGSMKPFIQPLKEEIALSFESPHYREVGDCSLITKHRYPTSSLDISQRSYTMSRFSELLIVNKADTLYWFSDLKDEQEPEALRKLLDMLIRSGADFNVRSVKEDASRELKPMITNFQN